MSDQKGLSAFLKKGKKDKKKATAGATNNLAANATAEETKAHDAEVAQGSQNNRARQSAANEDDSGSDLEDDELAQGLSYGNIKEKRDLASAKEQDDKLRAGYGFDEQSEKQGASAAAGGGKQEKPKRTAADITFGGGRPRFARGPRGKFGGEFSEGLDDIDDNGNVKKRNKELKGSEGAATGDRARDFVNLGASARTGGDKKPNQLEEEQKGAESKPVKPTFRGKLNLTKTGGRQEEENTGVVTSYGFSVALRGPQTQKEKHKKDKKEEGKDSGDQQRNARKDGHKNRDKGQPFAPGSKQGDDGMDDGGFEVVGEGRRRNRKPKPVNSDSDSDEGGLTLTRGSGRGGRGVYRGSRGGFFKTSRHDAAAAENKEGA